MTKTLIASCCFIIFSTFACFYRRFITHKINAIDQIFEIER